MRFKEIPLKETINDIGSSWQYCSDESYIKWTALTTPYRGRRVVELIKTYIGKNIGCGIDVGSSQGLTFGYLAQVWPEIIGIDTDEAAINVARIRLKKLGLKNKIIYNQNNKFPFKNDFFDTIISTEVYEHVQNQKLFIRELQRILKPGGKLLITSPNKIYPMECEFHLPFLSYMPKPIADFYVKLSGRGKSYDNINHPTYFQFKKVLSNSFELTDVTFEVIRNFKKYHLDRERGFSIKAAAIVISFILDLNKYFPKKVYWKILNTISFFSAGWIFVCTKK